MGQRFRTRRLSLLSLKPRRKRCSRITRKTWERLACTIMERGKARRARRKRKRLPAKVRVMVRQRSEKVEREARRSLRAVSPTLTRIITRRRRKRRRRHEPKASQKAGPQFQVKLTIPIGRISI